MVPLPHPLRGRGRKDDAFSSPVPKAWGRGTISAQRKWWRGQRRSSPHRLRRLGGVLLARRRGLAIGTDEVRLHAAGGQQKRQSEQRCEACHFNLSRQKAICSRTRNGAVPP